MTQGSNKGKDKFIRDGRAPIPVKKSTSLAMRGNKGKNTKPELVVRKLLWNNGLRGYRLHWKKVPGRPDIAYPGKKVAIFVNGCYWHRCPNCEPSFPKTNTEFWKEKFNKNMQRDEKKQKQLHDLGWKSIVVWECQVKNEPQKIVDKVREVLKEMP